MLLCQEAYVQLERGRQPWWYVPELQVENDVVENR